MKHMRFQYLFRQALLKLLFIFIGLQTANAQFVDLGQDPWSTRWKQIKTKNFQIIYPAFFEENAQYIANIYEKLYAHANSLGIKAKRMSMIVRANGGISNGNAGWAPKKSELYTSPSQDTHDSWLEHLCVHEFRHIVQYDKVNQGFSKALYYLFGEQITMAIVGLYIPMWYLEGDATNFETSVLPEGRGRSPEFLNQMKAQLVEKGIYSYDKAVLGSYKDFVPDRYVLGYFMVGNSRVNYGTKIWQDAITRVGRRPLGITPFATSLQHTLSQKRDSLWATQRFRSLFIHPDSVKQANTYKDAKRTLYRDNFCELQQVWSQETEAINHRFDTIPTTNRVYTNYHYPTPTPNHGLIAYKEGLEESGAFVYLNNNTEKIIFRPGIMYDHKFTFNRNTLLWTEYKPHLRWEHGGKMVLASYDIHQKKYRRYPAAANRYAPFAVNDHWGFIEVNRQNESALVIRDRQLQKELFRLTGRAQELFAHPTFDGQENIITVVVSPRGKWLEKINIHTKKRTVITPITHYELDNPAAFADHIIYRAAFNGNNALYSKDSTCSFGQNIANSRFGIRYPNLNRQKDTLYFSFYTADGYQPGKIACKQLQPQSIETKEFPIAKTLTQQEGWSFQLTKDSIYSSRKYNKIGHLVNIHSWGPIFPDRDETNIDFGIAVSSHNKLSTLYFTAGYVRGADYPHGNWQVTATYKGWWPTFRLELESGRQDDFARYNFNAIHKATGRTDTVYLNNKTQRTEVTLTMQLPFNLNKGHYYRAFIPYMQYEILALHGNKITDFASWNTYHTNRWTQNNPSDYSFDNSSLWVQIIQYGATWYNQTRQSDRDIYPRWSQRLHGGFAHTPWKKLDYGRTWWGEGEFYFPGLVPHHAFTTYLAHQDESQTIDYYSNKINSPRGMKLRGYQISSLRTSYYLPICYPDFPIGPVLYLKRITGGVFFDAGREKNRYDHQTNYSYGVEAIADAHLFRLPFPIKLGIRTGYETRSNQLFADMIFTVNFSL